MNSTTRSVPVEGRQKKGLDGAFSQNKGDDLLGGYIKGGIRHPSKL